MSNRPRRLSWDSANGPGFLKIGQKRIAMADSLPFDDAVKNAIASGKTVLADGSVVQTRRADGGIDRVSVTTPVRDIPREEKEPLRKKETGLDVVFCIETTNAGSPSGFLVVAIAENHTYVVEAWVPYSVAVVTQYGSTAGNDYREPLDSGDPRYVPELRYVTNYDGTTRTHNGTTYEYYEINPAPIADCYYHEKLSGDIQSMELVAYDDSTMIVSPPNSVDTDTGVGTVNTDYGDTYSTIPCRGIGSLGPNTDSYTNSAGTEFWIPSGYGGFRTFSKYCLIGQLWSWVYNGRVTQVRTTEDSISGYGWTTVDTPTPLYYAYSKGTYSQAEARVAAEAAYEADVSGFRNPPCADIRITYYAEGEIPPDLVNPGYWTFSYHNVTDYAIFAGGDTSTTYIPAAYSQTNPLYIWGFDTTFELIPTYQYFDHYVNTAKYYQRRDNSTSAFMAYGIVVKETDATWSRQASMGMEFIFGYTSATKTTAINRYFVLPADTAGPHAHITFSGTEYTTDGYCFFAERRVK